MLMGATAAGTPVNVSAIVTNLCGTSPNYCTWQSGANKQGGLEAFLTEAVSTRFIPDPHSSTTAIDVMEADAQTNCSSVAAVPTSTGAQAATVVAKAAPVGAAVAGGIAAGVGAGAAIGSAIPVVGTVIGAIAGLIAGIFASGHASAVKGEQQDICTAVPQVNAALQQIDAGLASGQVTPSQVPSLYSQLQSQFTSALHQGTTYKTGDALWAYNLALTGIIQARTQDLQNGQLTGGGEIPTPGTAGAAVAGAAATLGIPSWALLAGGAALLYFLW
jgi:hypothetical protein